MLLAIDIGNTNITVGIFDGNIIVKSWRLATDKCKSEDEYGIVLKNFINNFNLENKLTFAIISSVVIQLTERIEKAVKLYLNIDFITLTHKTPTNVKLLLKTPSEVGADRIANAVAASSLYNSPCIVVDFGTSTTFDIINADKNFIGGIIAAGMQIQADALNRYTSKLPKVRLDAPEKVIGDNTIDAMLSGIVRGHSTMIDGLIYSCEKELGTSAVTVATGGYSPVISKYMTRKFDYINPDLTLIGLQKVYEYNKNLL